MGKRRSIRLDTRFFEKAGDATTHFSKMLNRYSIGEPVTGADDLDLRALIKRHDQCEEKLGAGIDHFEVATAPDGYNNECFWIVRRDGTRIDFSFKHCLEAKPVDQ